jgi:hypothetical protein
MPLGVVSKKRYIQKRPENPLELSFKFKPYLNEVYQGSLAHDALESRLCQGLMPYQHLRA